MRKGKDNGKVRQDFGEVIELFKSLQEIRNGTAYHAPTPISYDPTVNVKEGATIERDHQRELRETDNTHRDNLDRLERHYTELLRVSAKEAADAVNLAERLRVDGTFAQLQNAVLVAAKEAQTTAEAMRENVAATAKAAQDTAAAAAAATNTAIKALEEKQYQAGGTLTGRELQNRENRYDTQQRTRNSQWLTALAIMGGLSFMGVIIGLFGLLATHLKFN